MRLVLLSLMFVACEDPMLQVDASIGDGAAVEVWEDQAKRTRREIFDWGDGATSAVTDFLFIVDPSVSMHTVIHKVDRGFQALVGSDAFPSKSRVAVLSTMPQHEDPSHAKNWAQKQAVPKSLVHIPHASVRPFKGVQLMPGLGALVNAEAIEQFRGATTEDIATGWEMDGCEPWFTPGATNPGGEPCMLAHTQSVLAPVRAEAGLVALHQWVSNALPGRVFRPGALVNVIIVSDTHEPGVPNIGVKKGTQALADMSPDPAALEEMILSTQGVAGVRFHAIAPATECGEQWSSLGKTYYRAAEASGGVLADVCTVEDYAPVIQQIVERGVVIERPVFGLGRPAEEVEEVRVGGRLVPFQVVANERAVVVEGASPVARQEVEVTYRYPLSSVTRPPAAAPVAEVETPSPPPVAPPTAPSPPSQDERPTLHNRRVSPTTAPHTAPAASQKR